MIKSLKDMKELSDNSGETIKLSQEDYNEYLLLLLLNESKTSYNGKKIVIKNV